MTKRYLTELIKTYVELSYQALTAESSFEYLGKALSVLTIMNELYASVDDSVDELMQGAKENTYRMQYEDRERYIKEAVRRKAFDQFENYFLIMCRADTLEELKEYKWKATAAIDIREISTKEEYELLKALDSAYTNSSHELKKIKRARKCEKLINNAIDRVNTHKLFLETAGTVESASIALGRILEILEGFIVSEMPGKYEMEWYHTKTMLKEECRKLYNDVVISLSIDI